MSNQNRVHNRAVWFDIPVADLDRAAAFYRGVLGCGVTTESSDGFSFGVLEHGQGNGGCLIPMPDHISRDGGVLLYVNVHGRIRDAIEQSKTLGGEIIDEVHPIGPHGFRAIILCESNRIALHSEVDS